MAQKEVVIAVCDLCGLEAPAEPADGTEPLIKSHIVALDSRAPWVTDTCAKCWPPYEQMLEKLREAGRSAKRAMNGGRRLARAS